MGAVGIWIVRSTLKSSFHIKKPPNFDTLSGILPFILFRSKSGPVGAMVFLRSIRRDEYGSSLVLQ